MHRLNPAQYAGGPSPLPERGSAAPSAVTPGGSNRRAVRVLHVYGRFHPDYTGDGIYYTRLINETSPEVSHHQVLAFYTKPPAEPLPNALPFPVHYLGLGSAWHQRLRLARWLLAQRDRFDVVHVHTHVDRHFVAYLTARLLGKSVIFSCSLDDGPGDMVDGYRPLYRWLVRRLLHTINVFVAISPQLKRSALREVQPHRVLTIPQGVMPAGDDARSLRQKVRADAGVGEQDTVILHVGAISERKNTCFIVEALGPLLNERVELWIAGPELEPDYARGVRALADSLGVGERVRFLGFVADPGPLYAAADVFVFASLKEGFPNVYLEAMRSGLPVVTTALPAMTDYLFEHGRTGFLCGTAQQFRDAVEALVNDREMARRVGTQAQAQARRFLLSNVARSYDRLYHQLHWNGSVEAREIELSGFQPRFCSDLSRGPAALGFRPVRLPASTRPMLSVVIDAACGSDWSAGPANARGDVDAMGELRRARDLFGRLGLSACYVVDYAVATGRASAGVIEELARHGDVIGAQLNPWTTPPQVEPTDAWHSLGGNLGPALERQKIEALCQAIESVAGRAPRVFKAGRHGLGPDTIEAIEALGFNVDLSVSPPFDFSRYEGPSFERFRSLPYWFGSNGNLLELPATGGFIGAAGLVHERLVRHAGRRGWSARLAARLAASIGRGSAIRLSPEGNSVDAMRGLTRQLLRQGCRTFNLTFHGASLEPGRTPCVRTAAERDELLGRIERYVRFFTEELDGQCLDPLQVRDRLMPLKEVVQPAPRAGRTGAPSADRMAGPTR